MSKTGRGQERASKKGRATELTLRVLALGATAAAAIVVGLARQTTDIAGIGISASYKSSPAFRYFVGGNGAAAAYCLLSLPLAFLKKKASIKHLLDLMATALVISAVSAATAIAYVAKKGNEDIGWPQVCTYFESFCCTVGIGFACSYAGFVLLMAVCSVSLFSPGCSGSVGSVGGWLC